jgi:hypothetical protein
MGSTFGFSLKTKSNDLRSKKVDCKKTKIMAFIGWRILPYACNGFGDKIFI